MAANSSQELQIQSHTRIIELRVSFRFRSSRESVPRDVANFGIGTLALIVLLGWGCHPVPAQPQQPSEPVPPDGSIGPGGAERECRDAQDQPFDSVQPGSSRPHRTTPSSLCVSVQSNGCTDRSSFAVAVAADGPVTRVTLKRIRPDPCRMRSHQIWLPFGWKELGLDGPRPVVIEEHTDP
jgi:hypothetical protein